MLLSWFLFGSRRDFLSRRHHPPVVVFTKRALYAGVVTKRFPLDTVPPRLSHQAMPPGKPKFIPLVDRTKYHRLEDVIGCKWSSSIVAAVSQGIKRPGELERYIPGISTKVLNERLRKLGDFGILSRTEYPGLPARVDYDLTETGAKLAAILEQVRQLNLDHSPSP